MSDMRIDGDKVFYTCPSCHHEFQFGRHRYHGGPVEIAGETMMVCKACYDPNEWNYAAREESLRQLRARLSFSGGKRAND